MALEGNQIQPSVLQLGCQISFDLRKVVLLGSDVEGFHHQTGSQVRAILLEELTPEPAKRGIRQEFLTPLALKECSRLAA